MTITLVQDLFTYEYASTAVCGVLLIAVLAGLWSPLIVAKERSYVTDALAHLVLPGTVLGYVAASAFALPVVLCVGIASALVALLGLHCWQRVTRIFAVPSDAAGVVTLSGFFAWGMILLRHQKGAPIPGIEQLFLGDVLTISWGTCGLLAVLLCVTLVLLFLFRHHWLCWVADSEFGRLAGYRMALLDLIFPLMLTALCLVGLFAVGGLMIAAIVVLPAVLFDKTKILSLPCVLGSVGISLVGLLGAFQLDYPLGPTIVGVGFLAVILKGAWNIVVRRSW